MTNRNKLSGSNSILKKDNRKKNLRRKSRSSSSPMVNYIMDLQRSVGNHAVEKLISSGALQPELIMRKIAETSSHDARAASESILRQKVPGVLEESNRAHARDVIRAKLRVGAANDTFEQEADRVAEQVVSMSHADVQKKPGNIDIRAKNSGSGSGSFTVGAGVESGIRNMKGSGRSLAPSVAKYYGDRFGHNFSNVRVHSGPRASALAGAINARAFTAGSDIFFAGNEFSPASRTGKMLLAHELTHVIQQGKQVQRNVVQCKKTIKKKKIPVEIFPHEWRQKLKHLKTEDKKRRFIQMQALMQTGIVDSDPDYFPIAMIKGDTDEWKATEKIYFNKAYPKKHDKLKKLKNNPHLKTGKITTAQIAKAVLKILRMQHGPWSKDLDVVTPHIEVELEGHASVEGKKNTTKHSPRAGIQLLKNSLNK
ncbi:MAG: DUF4157 domain-containing protein [bacterium]|nr:DUF4157 domain-containing protein [bacterium]